MGKKPAVKAKAKEAPAPAAAAEPEEAPTAEQLEAKRLWQQRREATKWAQGQLEIVRGQLLAAQKKGQCDWLQVAHEFHEVRLIRALKRLEEKSLDGIPQEVRERVEAYTSQCAAGPEVEKESFREEREAWDPLEAEGGTTYTRPVETPEATAVIEQLRAWSGMTAEDMGKFVELMQAHSGSGGVQEAGLVRIGGLFSEVREGVDAAGMKSVILMPAIQAAMRSHAPDCGVQRAGCAALRGLAMADGQLGLLRDAGGIELAVEAVNNHYKDKELAYAANGAFWAMAKAAGKNSPEISTMRAAKVPECLMKVMTHHAWDQTLCGKVRVTLPFITED